MEYQVLSRKWRPKTFSEVIGQEYITVSLKNSVLRERIAHAYLFTGTRGVGKTSVARIFAKSIRCDSRVNGEPCNKCNTCLEIDNNTSMDVFEMDAASNNSVDDIRNLIDTIQTLPSFGRYKIYIIDEVHMLSSSAFNAILKTLEEPPKHVVFILATTEIDKILETVISRCQRMNFKNLPLDKLISHIKNISEQEQIEFENDNLIKRICINGRGSVRDSLSIMDQVLSFCNNNIITEESLLLSLGIPKESLLSDVMNLVIKGDKENCSELLKIMYSENISLENFVTMLLECSYEVIRNFSNKEFLKQRFNLDANILPDFSLAEMFWIYNMLSRDLEWALNSMLPENNIELVLHKVCLRREFFSANSTKKKYNLENPISESISINWNDILSFIKNNSLPIYLHLEQGNLLKPIDFIDGKYFIKLAFSKTSEDSFKYLKEELYGKLLSKLSECLSCNSSDIKLDINLIDNKNVVEFHSVVEERNAKKESSNEIDKGIFLNHNIVKKAEKIFDKKLNREELNIK